MGVSVDGLSVRVPRLGHAMSDLWFVLRRSGQEFVDDDCPDKAAALTYYGVLSLFPALIAMLSLIGLVGDGPATVRSLLDLVQQVGADSAVSTVEGPVTTLAEARQVAGFALAFGLLTALWTASGYVGAFGRAVNQIYGVQEGRPFWRLRPYQALVTAGLLVLAILVALGLVVSGPLADALGEAVGLGDAGLAVWRLLKWPTVLVVVALAVCLLYYATPNVKLPRLRWIGAGGLVAVLGWVVASALFAVYVSNFGSYNRVYGSLAGMAVLLLWLWITNMALLYGAELNAELERLRELRDGRPAEKALQLELRDATGIEKARRREEDDRRRARKIRHEAGEPG
jgi:membrane protein